MFATDAKEKGVFKMEDAMVQVELFKKAAAADSRNKKVCARALPLLWKSFAFVPRNCDKTVPPTGAGRHD